MRGSQTNTIWQKHFEDLAERLNHKPAEQWVMVPGNHDVYRKAVKRWDLGQRDQLIEANVDNLLDDSEYWEMMSGRQTAFFAFTAKLLGEDRTWTAKKPWEVFTKEINGIKVGALGLNSAWACQDDKDKNKIMIGAHQVNLHCPRWNRNFVQSL